MPEQHVTSPEQSPGTSSPPAATPAQQLADPPPQLPKVDRSAAAKEQVNQMLDYREALVQRERRDLIESYSSAQLAAAPGDPLQSILPIELTARLTKITQSEKVTPKHEVGRLEASWNFLGHYSLLAQSDAEAAKGFSGDADRHATLILSSIEASLTTASPSQLDLALRDTKLVLALAPEAGRPAASSLFNEIFHTAATLPTSAVETHIAGIVESNSEFPAREAIRSAKDLNEVLTLATQELPGADPRWATLAATLTKNEEGYGYTTEQGTRWQISALGRPQLGSADSCQLIFTKITTKGESEASPPRCGFTADSLLTNVQNSNLDTRLLESISSHRAELNIEERKKLADLQIDPKKTAYIGVLPQQADRTTTNASFSTALMAHAVVDGEDAATRRSCIISDTPLAAIEKQITQMQQVSPKTKDIVLDISQHGSPEGLLFEQPFTAKEVRGLLEKFPNIHLHVCTLACHGGGMVVGLEKELQSHPTLAPRVSLFTQTKIEMLNPLSTTTKGTDSLKTSDFHAPVTQLLFIQSLLKIPGDMGKAFLESDSKTKKILPVDPEALLRGNRLSLHKGDRSQSLEERLLRTG